MRKNAVIKELRSIFGGICAPDGFSCGGISCGQKEDVGVALLLADKRSAVGCIFSGADGSGATYANKKRLRYGHARAILINGNVANAFQTNSIRNTEKLYYAVETSLTIPTDEILTLTAGAVGQRFPYDAVVEKIKLLTKRLGNFEEDAQSAAQAVHAKQLAFEGFLGDFPCKFGAMFRDGLVVITTDVNISTLLLQKALETEYRETLGLTDLGVAPTPNDTVCVLANGNAGNCLIDYEDTEYDKFCNLLRQTLRAVCTALATDEEKGIKPLVCTVQGAKSKQIARRLAKQVVCLTSVQRSYAQGKIDIENLVYAALSFGKIQAEKIQISLQNGRGKLVLFEGLHAFDFKDEQMIEYIGDSGAEILLSIGEGNYSATAIARGII